MIPGNNYYLLTGVELAMLGLTPESVNLLEDKEFKLLSCDRELEIYEIMPIFKYFENKKKLEKE